MHRLGCVSFFQLFVEVLIVVGGLCLRYLLLIMTSKSFLCCFYLRFGVTADRRIADVVHRGLRCLGIRRGIRGFLKPICFESFRALILSRLYVDPVWCPRLFLMTHPC